MMFVTDYHLKQAFGICKENPNTLDRAVLQVNSNTIEKLYFENTKNK